MCGPCSERYPHLAPGANRREPDNNEVHTDVRRRTSECPVPSGDDRRQRIGSQEGGPPQRSRSDSLPAQPPKQMQQRPQQPQNVQMRQEQGQPRPMHPNNGSPIRVMRPDHPQQGQQMRPQHPQQQTRPRYPNDQQRSQQPRDPRLQHPMDQRPHHPIDQKLQHPMDQRAPHQLDQRPPHPMDQRPPHPIDQRPPHPTDQRPPHPMDQRFQQPNDAQRLLCQEDQRQMQPNGVQQQQKVSSRPIDPRQQIGEKQRYQQDQLRSEHAGDNQNVHYDSDLNRQHLDQVDTSKMQTNNQRNQQPLDNPQRNQNNKDNHKKRSENSSNQYQSSPQKQQGPDVYGSSQPRASHPIENGPDFPQSKTYYPSEQLKPKPQHPIVHSQNRSHQGPDNFSSYPNQEILPEYPPQRHLNALDSNQIIPPQRNQRLREPPEQQVIPRPQHPQEPPQEFPQRHATDQKYPPEKQRDQQFNKSQHPQFKVMNDQGEKIQNRGEVNQNFQDNTSVPFGKQPTDNQQRNYDDRNRSAITSQPQPMNPSEMQQINKSPQPQQRQQINQQRNQSENIQRQIVNQGPNRHGVLESEQNDVYVSLSEQQSAKNNTPFFEQGISDSETQAPPATLPRTKRPEVPTPAGRTTKREKIPPTQTLPRPGTNPFRNDNNPFRRESLPPEILDAGEYVTVAPRRGSLDERFRHMSNQDQARLVDVMKAGEVTIRPASERRLEPQNSFEKQKSGPLPEEGQMSNRYLEEEQRRNAINSGVCPIDPNTRRQLPGGEPSKRPQHPQHPDQVSSPPVPKARTSLGDPNMHSEGRNGIPRTIPLTSLAQTLEQQSDPRTSISRQQECFVELPSMKNDKNLINDLSQHKQSGGSQGSFSQEHKRNEDFVHPNIVDNNAASGRNDYSRKNGDGSNKPKPPPTQQRQKMDRPREQPPYPPQVDRNNSKAGQSNVQYDEQAWRDARKSKPLPPESNTQDLEGYQDEEEEQNIDDYFEMIEKAISRPQQQNIGVGKRSSDIQRQLMNHEGDRNHAAASGSEYSPQKGQVSAVLRQIDSLNQNQGYQTTNVPQNKQFPGGYDQRNDNIKEKNDLNIYDKASSRKDFYDIDNEEYSRRDKKEQYIIQPTDHRFQPQQTSDEFGKQKKDLSGKSYDKLLLHELTPDTRQPSAKHYLEEHKTQPLSYEAFSSVKAMQQMQPDTRQEQHLAQSQKQSQGSENEETFGSPQKSVPGGSPQKTPAQPTTPRRSHRRLPQPTVEQMQAAVAMAAQGPRDKNAQPPSTTGQLLFGVEPKAQTSGGLNSPSSAWKVQEPNQSFEQQYNTQQVTVQPTLDNYTNVPSPAPRSQPRSASNGQKVGESVQPVPTVTLQDVPTPQVRRLRSGSYGGSTSPKPTEELMARLNGGGSSSPHNIMDNTTVGSPQTPSTPRDKTGDSSDTQSEAESIKSVRLRRKLPNLPPDQCASPSPTRKTADRAKNGNGFQDHFENESPSLTPAPTATVTTTVVTAIESSKEFASGNVLGAPSPTPSMGSSLSPLLGRRVETSRTPSPGGDPTGTKLPQYMQNLKQQLRDELKAVTEERKVMLEQRSRGDGDRSQTPQPPQTTATTLEPTRTISTSSSGTTPTVPKPLANTNTAALSAVLMKQLQAQTPHQAPSVSQVLPQAQTSTPISYQTYSSKPQLASQTTPIQTPTMSHGYRMPTQPQYQSQPQLLQYQNQPQFVQYQSQPQIVPHPIQPQTPMRGQLSSHYGSSQELHLYQSMMDSGRRTPQPSGARTPLPDAVPKYAITQRPSDDDITIMTTATTTVVSASEQWHDGSKRSRQPPTTTMAPSTSFMGTSVESLRRLQQKMTAQPTLKKGRRRHNSELNLPPFAQMEQAMHYQTMRQQQPLTPQYLQYYPKQVQSVQPSYRSMDFPSIDSHARATELLRSSASRFGGSLGSGFGSTEALYQGRRVMNNKLQEYFVPDNRMMEQQQRVVGPDAYFQTLNNEINRLRRSSENIHRDAIYDKPSYGASMGPPQTPVPEIRTSPQTTDRRKRKEKKSRKPRSWHPSPYVSEDEDDQMTREEKKAKIKAEIARRRQQIEENMRLHDELCKLAERRDRLEAVQAGRTTPVAYVPSPTGSIAYSSIEQQPMQPVRPSSRMSDTDDTSSVLKAIDEILRKDLYDRPLSRTGWSPSYNPADARPTDYYQSGYVTMPRNRYGVPVDARVGGAWGEEEQLQQQQQQHQQYFQESSADPETAMDESIMRIASTFPTDEPPDILLSATPGHFSPENEMTPAMPLLPDMPTRSRKLLENLGSSPIQPSRSGSAQSLYQDQDDANEDDSMGQRIQESNTLLRSQRKVGRTPVSKTSQKYDFPVKRILLTRDPKDRSVSGNGLGMKVVGGKEVPGSNGMIGAYVAKIFPGGVVETLGEVKEGDQVLEWNGIPLTGRTYEEVQRIIASSADEVEIVIRCDLNMLETLNRQRRSPGMGTSGGPRGGLEPPDTPGSGGPGRGGSPHSPYSPAGSSRGHSPALTKRSMGGGGGGGNMGNSIHNVLIANNINHASSYEHIQPLDPRDSGYGRSFGRTLISGSQTSQSVMNVFAPGNISSDWPELYEPSFFSSPPSPDDFIEDEFQSRWQRESSVEQVQFQVCCGPRTAIVYVPIMPARPMLKSAPPAILNRNHFTRRSVDHIDEYEPLLKNGWRTNERALGFYDLLRPRSSMGKINVYLNGLKEKAEVYEHLRRMNGVCRVSEEREEEPKERPRAPSDLPGLRPVFVNDWKGPKKVFKSNIEENDDNNNTTKSNCNQTGGSSEKARKPHVGSSPEASTPYNILPKGCRGSFCVIL
nr:protein piccolo isoform X2 [Parasteatoda tepidariorum]